MGRHPAQLSLKGRALQLLAQRDQSRVELRTKLLRHAAAGDGADDGVGAATVTYDTPVYDEPRRAFGPSPRRKCGDPSI